MPIQRTRHLHFFQIQKLQNSFSKVRVTLFYFGDQQRRAEPVQIFCVHTVFRAESQQVFHQGLRVGHHHEH